MMMWNPLGVLGAGESSVPQLTVQQGSEQSEAKKEEFGMVAGNPQFLWLGY